MEVEEAEQENLGCRAGGRAGGREAARPVGEAARPRGLPSTTSVDPRGGWRMAALRDFFFLMKIKKSESRK